MSIFKFHDSNYINKPNYPNIEASVDTYNGYQFVVSDGEAVAIADDTAAKIADIYVMHNIIDQPEIENTDDYHVADGDKIRAIRLKNHIGEKFDMSQDLLYFRDTGTKQVETATVAGAIAADGAGNASVVITSALLDDGEKEILVAVANNDTAAQVAEKIRTALTADADIGHTTTGSFVVSGATTKVILTAKVATDNDSTLNIAIADAEGDGGCSGLTAALESVNTTAGKMPITTNALMWADIAKGNYLVPRVTADTDYPMKWKKVSSVAAYQTYLEVTNKNNIGAFTYEKGTGDVLGGITVKVKKNDLTE